MSIVEDLIPYMRRVQAAERDLRDLSLLWQMIEASSAISCPEEAESILPMLTQTRVRFSALQARLVQQLAAENLAELREELASSAQCTIDILVRNLFERTADVGFLATDDVLRAFCAAGAEERNAGRTAFVQRLSEYRSKYTVYDDIVVVASNGEVLARLDESRPLAATTDPIVAAALARPGFVERFAPSDLAADDGSALLYAHRVDDGRGRTTGALVLRFRNADEMTQIFGSVVDPKRQLALLLLDGEDRVIASSDEVHVPVGAHVQTAADGEVGLTIFGGREYLSVTRATNGYQGYRGPDGWRAHAMVSLLTAFRSRHEDNGQMQTLSLSLDADELGRIQFESDAINGDLRRVVWNGRLVAGTQAGALARLKAVLRQINEAGTRTRDRVALAINDLFRSSLGRARHQAHELARLAADIMDRNLYERANDCRWWALSPVLQRVLAGPHGAAGSTELGAVLNHINGLYTVYSRLVAFDAQGVIRGVSNDDRDNSFVGRRIDPELLQAAMSLSDSQRYAVTPFAVSSLSGGAPTYTYVATVRSPQDRRAIGGIAIVFHAEREFRAMLDDVLAGRSGVAMFVEGDGRIIASTDAEFAPDGKLLVDPESGLVEHAGAQYAIARVRGAGYREFKCSDGYDNGAHAVVALRLGKVERRRMSLNDVALSALPTQDRARSREFALFHVGPGRFALPASAVLEARPRHGLVRAPMGGANVVGLLEVPDGRDSRAIPVVCARRLFGVSSPPRATDGVVIVLANPGVPGRPRLGLMVDQVSTVVDVGPEHLQPAPSELRAYVPSLHSLLRLAVQSAGKDGQEVLVQVIDAEALGGPLFVAPAQVSGAIGSAALEPAA
jgi:chemotaxis signal transduction protein